MLAKRLSPRWQLVIVIILTLIVLGIYGTQRLMPRYEALDDINHKLKKDQLHVEAPIYPDTPLEDVESLKHKDEQLDSQLIELNDQLQSLESAFAPKDTQDALLKISQTARTSGVRVIDSVPYIVQKRAKANSKATSNQKLTKKERKRAKKARKRARKLARAAKGVKTREGELMDRLVNDLDESRLLQKMTIQASFSNLKQFIEAIQNLPWQITIVKLDLKTSTQTAPQGLPQPLNANMIIAM